MLTGPVDRRAGQADSGLARTTGRLIGWARAAVPLDRQAWSLAAGLRAGLACSIPLLLAELLDQADLSWIAIVAFWGCLVDPGGAQRIRFRAMAAFAVWATLGIFLAVLLRPYLWPQVAFTLAWCFVSILARVWGDAATGVGMLGSVAFLVALGLSPESDLGAALDLAWLTACGVAWAMFLALVVWRQHPHKPARSAVALVLRDVADYVRALGGLLRPGTDEAAWEQVAQERRRACREAIEKARNNLIETRRGRFGRSARVGHLLLILADADRALARIIALNELLDTARSSPEDSRRLARELRVALGRFADEIDRVAIRIEGGKPEPVRPGRAFAGLRGGGQSMLRGRAADLLDQTARWIAAAAEHTAGASPVELEAPPAEPPSHPWREMQSNLTFRSIAFRHALRFAITAAVAVLLNHLFQLERGYWVTITAVAILQPYLSTTWQRAIERIVASVLGGLVAAGIAMVLHRPIEYALLIIPLSVLTLAVRGVNHALFILCLTPQFVLVAELFQASGLKADLAAVRAWDSVLGGLLGLAATFLLWPYREGPHLGGRLAEAVRANRDYLLAALDATCGAGTAEALAAAQRRAGLASNNAEASIQRLMSEPRAGQADESGPALTALAALRRLAGVAATLAALGPDAALLSLRGMPELRHWLGDGLEAMAAVMTGAPLAALPPAPALPDAADRLLRQEFERACRQVLLIEQAASRLASASQAA